jgi:hypothetical protein
VFTKFSIEIFIWDIELFISDWSFFRISISSLIFFFFHILDPSCVCLYSLWDHLIFYSHSLWGLILAFMFLLWGC